MNREDIDWQKLSELIKGKVAIKKAKGEDLTVCLGEMKVSYNTYQEIKNLKKKSINTVVLFRITNWLNIEAKEIIKKVK